MRKAAGRWTMIRHIVFTMYTYVRTYDPRIHQAGEMIHFDVTADGSKAIFSNYLVKSATVRWRQRI